METIGSKRSYALIWCMPNNDDDDVQRRILANITHGTAVNTLLINTHLSFIIVCYRYCTVTVNVMEIDSDNNEKVQNVPNSFLAGVLPQTR